MAILNITMLSKSQTTDWKEILVQFYIKEFV